MFDSTPSRNKTMVTGLFPDRASAEQAFQSVSERGYSKDDINVVMSDEARRQHFASDATGTTELGTKAAQGAGIGGAIGGSLGAIVAAIAAVGTSIAIPGAGLVIAGPLAAALAGAGAGGATGGLIGALIGYGIPEERVKHYEEGIKQGGILMGVTPKSDADAMHFENKFKEHKGEHVIGTGINAGSVRASGVVGDSATRVVNPVEEDAHWRNAYQHESYVKPGTSYDDYAPAYRLGYTGAVAHRGDFSVAEPTLASQWDSVKGSSKLSWAEVKEATRAAWNRTGL